MLPPIPTLRVNDTIYLGPLQSADRSATVAGLNDRAVFEQTLRIPFPYTDTDADAFLTRTIEGQKSGREFHFAIRNDSQQLIGGCGFHDIHESHRAEVGYWLARPFWGQGIMTATIRVLCDYGFEQLQLVRIVAHVFQLNRPSVRVLEKCGFQREGLLRKHFAKENKFIDVFVYGKIQ
jgi:RimJ/RimL family protein N-acetyltransferase